MVEPVVGGAVKAHLPGRILRGLRGRVLKFYRTHILRDPFELEVDRWFKARGDETLRLDYPLDEKSVVFDLGGYRGDFAAAIQGKYGCRVFLFEPVQAFYRSCVGRFEANPKVSCYPFGLSSEDGELSISDEADASSLVNGKAGGNSEKVKVRKITDFIRGSGVGSIDLMKINIEGGEFDILPCLIAEGMVRKVRFIQVQFHPFIPGAQEKRDRIRTDLAKTHKESWNYPFVWESWELK